MIKKIALVLIWLSIILPLFFTTETEMGDNITRTTPSIPKRPQKVRSKLSDDAHSYQGEISDTSDVIDIYSSARSNSNSNENVSTTIPPIPRRPNKGRETSRENTKFVQDAPTSSDAGDSEEEAEHSSPISDVLPNHGEESVSDNEKVESLDTKDDQATIASGGVSIENSMQDSPHPPIGTMESFSSDNLKGGSSSSVTNNSQGEERSKSTEIESKDNSSQQDKPSVIDSAESLETNPIETVSKTNESITEEQEVSQERDSKNPVIVDSEAPTVSSEKIEPSEELIGNAKSEITNSSDNDNQTKSSYEASKNSEEVSNAKPVVPKRPSKNSSSSITASDTPKVPPSKPKKLSSKIAAFQQLLNESKTGDLSTSLEKQHSMQNPLKPKPVTSKLSNDKMQFAQNLQGMMQRSIVPPNTTKLENVDDSPSNEYEPAECDKVIPRSRTRGPRGKRLPKALREPDPIVSKPKFSFFYTSLFSIDIKPGDKKHVDCTEQGIEEIPEPSSHKNVHADEYDSVSTHYEGGLQPPTHDSEVGVDITRAPNSTEILGTQKIDTNPTLSDDEPYENHDEAKGSGSDTCVTQNADEGKNHSETMESGSNICATQNVDEDADG